MARTVRARFGTFAEHAATPDLAALPVLGETGIDELFRKLDNGFEAFQAIDFVFAREDVRDLTQHARSTPR